jgi:hypothetical protein
VVQAQNISTCTTLQHGAKAANYSFYTILYVLSVCVMGVSLLLSLLTISYLTTAIEPCSSIKATGSLCASIAMMSRPHAKRADLATGNRQLLA